jgi:hypothetical protein
MIDRDDLSDLHSAAVTVQDALAELLERLGVLVPAEAPDTKLEGFIHGNKTQITLTISPELLDRLDEVAHRKEISRDALLRLLIGDGLAKWEAP